MVNLGRAAVSLPVGGIDDILRIASQAPLFVPIEKHIPPLRMTIARYF